MSFLTSTFIAVCCANLVFAGTRYLAIPIDGVDVIELNTASPAGSRISRQAESYVPIGSLTHLHHAEASAERPVAHILDYVDFGAHTGSNGAFSWYADFPSHR